jgi:hypothetical protein
LGALAAIAHRPQPLFGLLDLHSSFVDLVFRAVDLLESPRSLTKFVSPRFQFPHVSFRAAAIPFFLTSLRTWSRPLGDLGHIARPPFLRATILFVASSLLNGRLLTFSLDLPWLILIVRCSEHSRECKEHQAGK